jgi:succinate dehydrogenase flavin-adding protein (antitoxin of CptAB toxin-antitoxin module)
MNNFGKIKSKLLKTITEAYEQGELKNNTKNLIKVVKKNKDFREMYMFYEEIENKYFDDKEVARLYVEEIGNILKQKAPKVKDFCEVINMSVYNAQIDENELYNSIDQLLEEDSLKNIDKKVVAKKKLVEHLTTKKEIKESQLDTYTSNENLLHAVLANNFNVLYVNNLNEEQQKELKNILSISNEDLVSKTTELKESIINRVGSLLSESNDNDLTNKLSKVKDEVQEMELSKYNYYRLTQLKNGLD